MKTNLNIAATITATTRFIEEKLLGSGLDGFILGLSGGIDSALSAALAAKAVGAEKVLGVMMPYRTSADASVADAKGLAEKLGIDTRLVDISPMIDAYYPVIDKNNALRAGNKMARERMSILFDIAHESNSLVLGTGNRTEICLGYTTWFGDSACSINPLGELYKCEVRLLARELGIPDSILEKPPSADLWAGQTDEAEIGVTYDTIDALLRLIVDEGVVSISTLAKRGFAETDISRVVSLMNRFSFKRRLPDIAPVGRKAIPNDIQLQS
ncbi:MAG: NAD+ synthase [candidate division Zixibacteria bacterium]|nr:NAD+ synthase [candidate division Zixibacteria bacterium]